MTAPARPVIDVRDMLCAQAIMAAAKAAKPLAPGAACDIICNAADVQRDLLLWANEMQFTVSDVVEGAGDIRLTITRR